jgi:HPt (histidine-containing phosphotransfer) domain-containing protein
MRSGSWHSLKGSSGTFGAMALAGSCGELQAVASSGDLAKADGLMDTVGADFERAGAALREELLVGTGEPSQD